MSSLILYIPFHYAEDSGRTAEDIGRTAEDIGEENSNAARRTYTCEELNNRELKDPLLVVTHTKVFAYIVLYYKDLMNSTLE